LAAVLLLSARFVSGAAEVIPPQPPGYFHDAAGVVSKEAALRFNEQLAQFERETSNQIVVAIYRNMSTHSDIADYTQRVAQSWGVGQANERNGAVLFVFVEDRKMYIQVGYGLEGAIPDATAFDITERRIKPRFRENDYEGGLATGIESIMQAARGEYTGTGKTIAESDENADEALPCLVVAAFIVLWLFLLTRSFFRRKGRRRGWGYSGGGGPYVGGWSGGSSGWSGGSSSGGGFSGFSGGGGSFGGGGGGSSW